MKNTLKKIVDAFVSNASKVGRVSSDAIGTIASTWTIALALTFGLAPHIASAAQLASLGGYGAAGAAGVMI